MSDTTSIDMSNLIRGLVRQRQQRMGGTIETTQPRLSPEAEIINRLLRRAAGKADTTAEETQRDDKAD